MIENQIELYEWVHDVSPFGWTVGFVQNDCEEQPPRAKTTVKVKSLYQGDRLLTTTFLIDLNIFYGEEN